MVGIINGIKIKLNEKLLIETMFIKINQKCNSIGDKMFPMYCWVCDDNQQDFDSIIF